MMVVFAMNGFGINISGLSCLLGRGWLVLCYIDGAASWPILLSKRWVAKDACVYGEWFLDKHQWTLLLAWRVLASFVLHRWLC